MTETLSPTAPILIIESPNNPFSEGARSWHAQGEMVVFAPFEDAVSSATELSPIVTCVDLSSPSPEVTLDLIARVKTHAPRTNVFICAHFLDAEHIPAATNAGASEYFFIPPPFDRLSKALRCVRRGSEPNSFAANPFKGMTLAQIERTAVQAAIEDARGSIPKAARALNVSPSTLYRKLESWGEPPRSRKRQ
ncbi:DNA-binding response regulator [Celeribacter arenosi]|uniref:DNA binding HTH domain-containing protein n=1 Tax=Celeribacter arenosi TaxID=792649 RepID=A0ABP7K3P7_9RHOB